MKNTLKKSLSVFIAVAVFFLGGILLPEGAEAATAHVFKTRAVSCPGVGDPNGDGLVDEKEVRGAWGNVDRNQPVPQNILDGFDINKNGQLDSHDKAELVRYLRGDISTLPYTGCVLTPPTENGTGFSLQTTNSGEDIQITTITFEDTENTNPTADELDAVEILEDLNGDNSAHEDKHETVILQDETLNFTLQVGIVPGDVITIGAEQAMMPFDGTLNP